MPQGRLSAPEALAVCGGGALLGAATGWALGGLVGVADRSSFVVAGALIAWGNGLVSGARQIYEWRRPRGWMAFALDSSWALLPVAGALLAHAVAAAQRGRGAYVAVWSVRQNRHVYRRGFRIRPGFLVTIGNTVNNVGGLDGRRRRIVDDHEQAHVWQARWFGPLFPLLYGGWMLAGAAVGVLAWTVRRALGKPGSLAATVDAVAYYANPFEWWAYSREGRWPPPGAGPVTWRRPLVTARSIRGRR